MRRILVVSTSGVDEPWLIAATPVVRPGPGPGKAFARAQAGRARATMASASTPAGRLPKA